MTKGQAMGGGFDLYESPVVPDMENANIVKADCLDGLVFIPGLKSAGPVIHVIQEWTCGIQTQSRSASAAFRPPRVA
jgi:hypothetical protein